jgi:hypothetical protein
MSMLYIVYIVEGKKLVYISKTFIEFEQKPDADICQRSY